MSNIENCSNPFEGWFKIMARQWSWNNDRWSLLFSIIFSVITVVGYHYTGNLKIEPLEYYWAGFVLGVILQCVWIFGVYHFIKLMILSPSFLCICYFKNKGNTQALETYNKAWDWRQ